MKRLRDIETRVVAEQMVTLSLEERLTIPQAVLFLFSHVDELILLLKSRPILVINLMQTNREMYEVFSARIPGLWPLLLDQLVANESGEYTAMIYPFFVCEQDAMTERRKRVLAAFDWPAGVRRGLLNLDEAMERMPYASPRNWSVDDVATVTVVYADGIIAQCQDLMHFALCLAQIIEPTFDLRWVKRSLFYSVNRGDETIVVRELGDALRVWSDRSAYSHPGDIVSIILRQLSGGLRALLAELDEFSQVEAGDHVTISRSLDPHTQRDEATEGTFPAMIWQVFAFVRQLAVNINMRLDALRALSEDELATLMPPLVLGSQNIMPYRRVAFQILYSTPEEQRRLLLRILRDIANMKDDNTAMIKKYGNSVSHCAICGLATQSVSLASLLPRCGDTVCQQFSL